MPKCFMCSELDEQLIAADRLAMAVADGYQHQECVADLEDACELDKALAEYQKIRGIESKTKRK